MSRSAAGLKQEVGDVGPKARSSRRRWNEITDAAARIFHEKGYEAASIQDVAEAVGMLKGSLYYYIDSKEDLLFAVLREVHEGALSNAKELAASELDPLSKIRAFIEGHVVYNAANLVKSTVFFHDFRSLGDKRKKVIIEERDLYEGYLRDVLRQGQREGVICPDIDPRLATIGILGMLNWMYHWYMPGGEYSAQEIARQYADLLISGLACDRAAHRRGHRGKIGHGGTRTPSATRRRAKA